MNTQINWEESPKGTTHALVAVMEDALFGWVKVEEGMHYIYNRTNMEWVPCNQRFLKMPELTLIPAPQPNEFLDNLHQQIQKAYSMGYYQGYHESTEGCIYNSREASKYYMENFK